MSQEFTHTTVLLEETVAQLPLACGEVFVDCTMGGGGHSERILQLSTGRLIAIDKDDQAFLYARKRLAPYADRVTFVKSDFHDIKRVIQEQGVVGVDGIVVDLGVSSFQLDDAERGFSYQKDAPIDMRMDRQAAFSAYDIVNGYDKQALQRVIYEYGEERYGARIADAIIRHRPIETTLELAEIIKQAIPAASRRTGPHPAKRTFQALRIEVNDEIGSLQRALEDMIDVLSPGGVLSVITFHSLEDRIVKNTFRTAEHPCTCPPEFPQCICGKKSKGRVLTRKPILPSEEELERNPRARSAKLRAFCKTTEE
ncbi:MAG: 16S rRNA (cytosine(1402)-N(4))-methyltransferase RsmH [Christensenellaceae bacterium]